MITLEILTTSLGCAKCDRAMDIIHSITKKYKGKVKVIETDIIKNPEKLTQFGIMSTPAIIIDGKLAFEGTPNKDKLDKKIKEVLK